MGILVNMVKRYCAKKESMPNIYWCEIYKVRGINPETNRKKSVEVVAASNAPDELIQSKSGLLPPYEVEKATRPATEAQLETLRKHGFNPPANLSIVDASIFITRSVEGEPYRQPVASLSFTNFAIENDVYISKYANEKEARDYLLDALPDKKREIKELK